MTLRLNAASNCGGTLSAAVTSSTQSSISVLLASGSLALPAAPFRVALFSASATGPIFSKYEVMEVSGVSGTGPYTLTVTRGEEGTTAQSSWSAGDNVVVTFTEDAYSELQSAGLLAVTNYAPSSQANYSTTSATLVAVDSTNLTTSFVVPPSGKVMVKLAAYMGIGSNTGYANMWGLVQHGTSTQIGDAQEINELTSVSLYLRAHAEFLLTGLTPGSTQQFDWAWSAGSTSNTLKMWVTNGASNFAGPAVMEVWAA